MVKLRLTGRRVAVTRAQPDEDALSRQLRALGAEVLEFPAIAIVPLPLEATRPLDEALRQLHRFDWVVFASANAVEQTLERMKSASVPISALSQRRLAVVGPATAQKLSRAARAPDLIPAQSRAAALVATLGPLVRGQRVLIPRAEEGRPELVDGVIAAGAEVIAPIAYRTEPVPPENLRELGDLLERSAVDAVVFASPSAVRSVVAALSERAGLLSRTVIAAIGPTTAEAVLAAGLRVDVQPARGGAESLVEALAERLAVGMEEKRP